MQQDIINALNEAVRKYLNKTPKEERTNVGVIVIM